MITQHTTINQENVPGDNTPQSIGQSQHWDKALLSNSSLFHFENGLWTGKKPPFVDCAIIRNTNFTEYGDCDLTNVAIISIEQRQLEKKKLFPGDIIIERSGGGPQQPVGRVVYFDENEDTYCFSNFTTRLRVIDTARVYPKYLHYYLLYFYLSGSTEKLQNHTTGIRNLAFEDYKKTVVYLPPLPEQRAIAHTLQTIQQAIQTRRKELELERERKAALMQHLFTHGTRNEPTKQSEVGEIPESWSVTRIAELAEVQSGGTPLRNRKDFHQGQINWIKTLDLNDGVVTNTQEKITKLGLESIRGKIRPVNTVMIAMYGGAGTIGKTGLLGLPAATNQAVCCIHPNPEKFNSLYLLFYLIHIRSRWMKYAIGTRKDPNISKSTVEKMQVPLPPLSEQEAITYTLRNCSNKIAALEKEITLHEELFRTLLDELMTGRISTLPLIEEQLEKMKERDSDR